MMARLLALLLILLSQCVCAAKEPYRPLEGDLVFQSLPRSELVDAIEGISRSHYSHVGIVIRKNNDWYVREAIGMVIDTPLASWESRGRYRRALDAFRLRDDMQHFVPGLIKQSESFLGRPYDYKYDMDDEHIYCSELPYKSMLNASGIKLGKLQKLGELRWRPYRSTIEAYEGGKPPLERLMITPIALSEAPELVEVYHGYSN
jgi:hypothetical protein